MTIDRPGTPRRRVLWYSLTAALAAFTYFYGLDGQHIPKNGDEYPYEHITRMTAASGRWLPLQSELKEMRNTKPPLLFWQGVASTNRGKDWALWNLRWPSVVYTLLTAALAFLVAMRLSGRVDTGLLALITFLAFFSTYRYGRPFLTDAPSVFWLFVPCAAVLASGGRILESRLSAPILVGIATGVGLLYKSFALLLPVAIFLAWGYLRRRSYHAVTFLKRDTGKLAIVGVIALAMFSLWFVLDPDPRAIVNEFVLRENAAKFDAPAGYLGNLVWGRSSLWRLVVSYPLNAGLLLFPVIALFVVAFKRRDEWNDGEKLLWMWVLTLFVVFSLPSQRDERYLLPAMPALAVLCALNWDRISGLAFKSSLAVTGTGLLALGYLSLRLEAEVPGEPLYSPGFWVLVIGALLFVAASLFVPGLARPGVNTAVVLAMLCFAAALRPLDGVRGSYGARARELTEGRSVWVPTNFIAKEEGHRFLLPGADVRGYPLNDRLTATELAARYPLFAIRLPINGTAVGGGSVLGERLDIATRQTPDQIRDMLRGNVFENLFVKELLVEAPATAGTERGGGAH